MVMAIPSTALVEPLLTLTSQFTVVTLTSMMPSSGRSIVHEEQISFKLLVRS